jgi:hypothetical protein
VIDANMPDWILPHDQGYHTLAVKEGTEMLDSSLMVDVLIRERQADLRAIALRHALAAEHRGRRSFRERLGLSLIQAGRALLRHRPAYAPARRRLA